MAKPVTPLVGCDVFVTDTDRKVLLIQRADNGLWALPGGCQDPGETPRECAEREAREETGYQVRATALLGVFSSKRYPYVHYPWKENEFCHLLFRAEPAGGEAALSGKSRAIGWFAENALPPLSDGHEARILVGFGPAEAPYFE